MTEEALHPFIGKVLRDRVTGVSGECIGVTVYANGCVQALLEPPVGADGNAPKHQWVDSQRLMYDELSILAEDLLEDNERAVAGGGHPSTRR